MTLVHFHLPDSNVVLALALERVPRIGDHFRFASQYGDMVVERVESSYDLARGSTMHAYLRALP